MEKIRERTKKKALTWKSGTLHLMDVYSQAGVIIGRGYVISFTDDTMSAPALFDFMGRKLPEDWYGLKIYEYKPCVCPLEIQ